MMRVWCLSIRCQRKPTHRNDALSSGDGAILLKGMPAMKYVFKSMDVALREMESYSRVGKGVCDAAQSFCQLMGPWRE